MKQLHSFRRLSRLAAIFGLAAIFFAILACWIIPYRLRFGAGGSYYTPGFVGDEYEYAADMQPLISGTTSMNTLNGICDPTLISQKFLTDVIRIFLTLSGIKVLAFYWIWRLLFPIVLAGATAYLAVCCLPDSKKAWGFGLRISLAGAAFAGMYCLYDFVNQAVPLQGFINRIPTGIEYPLSVAMAAATIRMLRESNARNGLVLAAASVALVYIRPYAAIPWGLAVVIAMAWQVFSGRMSVRTGLTMLLTVILGLVPWIAIDRWNKASSTYKELTMRYFHGDQIYSIHPKVWLYLGFAACFAIVACLAPRAVRAFFASAAGTMALLPFICGLLSIRRELLSYDRFGCFYLVVCAAGGLSIVGERIRFWRGKAGFKRTQYTAFASALVALCASASVALHNTGFDFNSWGPYRYAAADIGFVPAYEWLRDNTPPEALILVGEGYDYSIVPENAEAQMRFDVALVDRKDDLFAIVAQRRRVYLETLRGQGISNEDLYQLAMLHRGTLGLPVDLATYKKALARFRPSYVLWRKVPAVPLTETAPAVPRQATGFSFRD